MEWLTDPQAWIGLLTLTMLEIVLGIDNIIFISILAGKLPPAKQRRARQIGLGLAMLMRSVAALTLLGCRADETAFRRGRLRCIRTGLDPDRRRLVPAREEHP